MSAEILWCKITQSGVLQFDGVDAQSFLQGQLTNNVAALDAARSHYTGYCNPKGRLLAVMLLWQREGAYHLLLPLELCEAIRKRLSMYILRAKVKASDVSSQWVLFGLSGSGAAAVAGTLAGSIPDSVHGVVHAQDLSLLKLPRDRYLIVANTATASHIEAMLTAVTPPSAETLWPSLDIDAGIPIVVAATQEQFVPQTVNLDRIGALSFDKGCYTGQEIVARTHYLGKVKQRMVRARVQSDERPVPGDKLFSVPFGEQASGMIVNALSLSPSQHEVLAVVQASNIEAGDVHWQSPAGPVLQFEPLPYPLP